MRSLSGVVGFQYWRFGIGGAERATCELMERLVSVGYEVVLYTDAPPSPGDHALPDGVVRKVAPPDPADRCAFWEAEVGLHGLQVLVYGTWLSRFAPGDCAAARAAGARVVYWTHGVSTYFIDKADGLELLGIMESCARAADVVTCLSDSDVPFWRALCPNVLVVTNPIDEYRQRRMPPRTSAHSHRVAWVGRLDPVEKRSDLAIRAFSALRKLVPDARLVMVGGGNDDVARSVRELASELSVLDAVEFVGAANDPFPYLEGSDAYMLTSPTEGFCLSLCEAMCSGLPSVMFRMPNLVLPRGCDGIVQVPWGDAEAMGEALAGILLSGDYESLCRSARARFEEVLETDVVGQWRRVIAAALDGRGQAPETAESRFVECLIDAYRRLDQVRDRERREAEALREEVGELSRERGQILGSVSFRLGRAVTKVPRMLRDALAR